MMINVNRLDCPDILKISLTPESEGEIETKDAIEFFKDSKNHEKKFSRTGANKTRIKAGYIVYSDKSVRELLLKMFHGKCSYCESRITTIYNGDIEHYRPKGKIKEAASPRPGYYWLASEWENLLFACPFCNQTNTHKIIDGGKIQEIVVGKLDQFPLISELNRLNYTHGDIYFSDRNKYQIAFALEESDRLLLNPCKDATIENYFKYSDDGIITINDALTGIDIDKAKKSIDVYALNRLNLCISRKEKILQIKAQIKRVETAIKNYSKYMDESDEESVWFEGIMREEMQILKRFKDSDQEYAGLARYIIDKYFDEAKFV